MDEPENYHNFKVVMSTGILRNPQLLCKMKISVTFIGDKVLDTTAITVIHCLY